MSKSVYEIIDESDDEMYHSLGMFPSLGEAKAVIENAEEDSPISDYADEYETISVVERKLGMYSHGETVFKLSRECHEDDVTGQYLWKVVASEQ